MRELDAGETLAPGRVRRPGGGRKSLTETDPTLLADLERLLEADSRSDPELPLRWTSKSVRKLAEGLRGLDHQVRKTINEYLGQRALPGLPPLHRSPMRRFEPDRV